MIRKLLAVSVVALGMLPAGALASTSSHAVHFNASKQCAEVQAKIGPISFEHAFASFGSCVSALTSLAPQNVPSAATSCRGERADASFAARHGGKTFGRFYGIGRNSADDFAVCVALNVHPAVTVSPSQPSQTPAATTVVSGCGSLGVGAGPARPLVSRCAVANAN